MQVRPRGSGPRFERGVAAIVAVACLALALVIFLAESGTFSRLGKQSNVVALPGITVDDDDGTVTDMPVVTSLRSHSEAERLGVRVGDHISAVDGHPVRSVAALRAAIVADHEPGPVALHIRRGSAVWNVAIDRSEPPDGTLARAGIGNDAQDPAD